MKVPILSTAEQNRYLQETVKLSLDNFSLAAHLVELLKEYADVRKAPPQATVLLRGLGRCVDIPGRNCGFVTTPVIQMAILDCRRTLAFFGISRDARTQRLIKAARHHQDDLSIGHFGLSTITPTDLMAKIGRCNIEQTLVKIHQWASKRLAHYTLTGTEVSFDEIRDASTAMIQAYLLNLVKYSDTD